MSETKLAIARLYLRHRGITRPRVCIGLRWREPHIYRTAKDAGVHAIDQTLTIPPVVRAFIPKETA